ncbi:MAG: hypothetical protein ACRYFK_17665 [Janthinobacterium lividum]
MSLLLSSQTTLGRWFAAICLAILVALATRTPAAAQAAAPATIRLQPEDLQRGQYGPQQNFFFMPPGKTGEESYQSAGFFGQKLRPFLGNNQEALASLNAYKRQKSLYLADRALLVGSVLGYGAQVYNGGDPQYASAGQIVAGGLLITSLVATLFINRHTSEYLKQAVDSYNTDLPATRRGSLRQLRPASYGLAATPQGRPVLALGWQL